MLGALRQVAFDWPLLGSVLAVIAPSPFDSNPEVACKALNSIGASALPATTLNTTILNATYIGNSTLGLETRGVCASSADVSVPLCRVAFSVDTSSRSQIVGEAWLPTEWTGRSLVLGNGGLGGCIDYLNLQYGSSLGFATLATNNGHDGNTGKPFENNSEVLADFTSRSIHIASLVVQQLMNAYYSRHARKSYYLGCSTGGRQGLYAALYHPDDFDGIIAGAPATNQNHLLGWRALVSKMLGAPDGDQSPKHISRKLWDAIGTEVMRQCDGLDGVKDGIVTEPDACEFRPEELICQRGMQDSNTCLTRTQVEVLKELYRPLFGLQGEQLFPRFDPGAESTPEEKLLLNGDPFPYSFDWMKYVIDKPDFDFASFSLKDIERMDALDPGNISTFRGDLSAFREKGGKIISFHGRADSKIPSGNAKAFYNLVSLTLEESSKQLDNFYRLFLIPGMGHCSGGVGSPRFGQDLKAVAPELSGASHVLLDLVDWVEHGRALDVITGSSEDGLTLRDHCRYPMRSLWNGSKWTCVE